MSQLTGTVTSHRAVSAIAIASSGGLLLLNLHHLVSSPAESPLPLLSPATSFRMLPSKQTIFRRTKNVYRGSRRHVTKYVARAVYAGRQYSQYRRGDSTSGTAPGSEGNVPLHRLYSPLLR